MKDVKDDTEKLQRRRRERRKQREIADAVLLASIDSMQREVDCLRKEGLELQRRSAQNRALWAPHEF
jgi:hypothetical protein